MTNELHTSPFAHISHPVKKAFLAAFAETGRIRSAAKAVGFDDQLLWTSFWKEDAEFQAAMDVAREMYRHRLEEEAIRRAVDGDRSYKFTKDGTPQRHPEVCVCGHGFRAHLKDPTTQARHKGPCASEVVDVDGSAGRCDCEAFLGAPYYEDKRSDTMLIFTMKGVWPEKYGDRVEFRGALANIDLARLPHHMIAKIAAGQHPLEVLAEGAGEAVAQLNPSLQDDPDAEIVVEPGDSAPADDESPSDS